MRFSGPRVVALAVVAAGFTMSAHAADLPAPAAASYPPAIMPPAVYDWGGIYGGGHIGVGLMNDTYNPLTAGPFPSTALEAVGLIGGAQAGVNFQFSSVVAGAEVSWTASTTTDTKLTTSAPVVYSFTSNPQWIGAATGRIGFAANTLLFYAKGGGAWMHANYEENNSSTNVSNNRTGYTAGGGVEYGMTENLSAKLEYDYYGFGTKNYPTVGPGVSIRSTIQALTVGLNYRFTWAPSGQKLCPTC